MSKFGLSQRCPGAPQAGGEHADSIVRGLNIPVEEAEVHPVIDVGGPTGAGVLRRDISAKRAGGGAPVEGRGLAGA